MQATRSTRYANVVPTEQRLPKTVRIRYDRGPPHSEFDCVVLGALLAAPRIETTSSCLIFDFSCEKRCH